VPPEPGALIFRRRRARGARTRLAASVDDMHLIEDASGRVIQLIAGA
jgi:hypothetical protein